MSSFVTVASHCIDFSGGIITGEIRFNNKNETMLVHIQYFSLILHSVEWNKQNLSFKVLITPQQIFFLHNKFLVYLQVLDTF